MCSVIKEEGEDEEDEEEIEDEEEEDDVEEDGEEGNKADLSQFNPVVKSSVEVPTVPDIKPETTAGRNKRAEEVGYSLLDGQDATEDEPEAASSSCSSDLSFGASSSGTNHKYIIDRLV